MSQAYRARAVLLDIEGTTGSIAFVHEVLFPYARAHMADYVARNAEAVEPVLTQVGGSAEAVVRTLLAWMDEDRKETPLKTLQGMIWRQGYESGALKGHVYPDAVRAMRAWSHDGLRLYIYSSGSVEAQRLLFAHSVSGDLTPLLSGYFDTTSGPKREPGSYSRIAAEIGGPPADILFLSDAATEIDAALAAGMQAALVGRDRGPGLRTFDELKIEALAA